MEGMEGMERMDIWVEDRIDEYLNGWIYKGDGSDGRNGKDGYIGGS